MLFQSGVLGAAKAITARWAADAFSFFKPLFAAGLRAPPSARFGSPSAQLRA
ncbi:hypothetical protein E1H18_1134 [Caulobacter sp. RHG1]|nr:hypothetical protein [Caulobacter sp. RHG1]